MGRRPHRPSRRAFGPRRGLAASELPGVRRRARQTPTEYTKGPDLPAAPAGVRSNGRRWKLAADNTSAHEHKIAYDLGATSLTPTA
jgi:hypothetical protein